MQGQPVTARRSSFHSDIENTHTSQSAKRPRLEGRESSASPVARMQRAGKACDACRRGKVRCGGQRPQCGRCMENELPCSYTSPHRRRGPERGANLQINQRMTCLENILQDTLNELHRGHSTPTEKRARENQTSTVLLDSFAVSPGSPVEAHPHVSSVVSDRAKPTASPAQETMTEVAVPSPAINWRSLDRISPKSAVQNQWNGPGDISDGMASDATPPMPLLTVDAYAHYPSDSRGDTHVRSMPSIDIVLHLIDTYFEYVHNEQYGFLDRGPLVKGFLDGTVPPVLIYSICAVSARFSNNPALQHSPPYQAGENFAAEAAELITRNIDHPNIVILQSLLLLCLHAAGASKGAKAWMLGGMAFRLCYALRLDKEENWTSDRGWRNQEMRSRTFWTAFLVDRFSSAGSDVPWSISVESSTQRLPASERHFRHNQTVSTPRIFDLESSDTGGMGCIAYIVRLAELWGRIARYVSHGIGNILPDQTASPFTILKTELQDWFSKLPHAFLYTPENLTAAVTNAEGGSFAFMHILYHAACSYMEQVVLVNFRSELPESFVRESESRSNKNALLCCEIYTKTTVTYPSLLSTPLTAYFLFISGVILARQSFCAEIDIAQSARNGLLNSQTGLDRLRRHWGPAERYSATLRGYYAACQRFIDGAREKDALAPVVTARSNPQQSPTNNKTLAFDTPDNMRDACSVTTSSRGLPTNLMPGLSTVPEPVPSFTELPATSWPLLGLPTFPDDSAFMSANLHSWPDFSFNMGFFDSGDTAIPDSGERLP
ncbi:fungal-specific transcription factor domain-containing protein [Calycina marina]|uniref:Fungal-specific transcription factor domain-containing protein n=1 Tax=Calycina marina TaxID=1763456 RepID=A0A9P7Z0K6_9HELO|nr:fungal-specific transcription factor domain-containing protein [Calycina marina]